MTPWERVAYDLGQTARVAWFLGHAFLAERLTPPLLDPDEVPDNLPERAAHLRHLMALMVRDRANIAAGHYRLPHDVLGNPLAAWRQSRRFLADFGRVNLRRQRRRHQELHRAGSTQRYPRYYLQNFHYQSDGYLSAESAELYDFQVEVLFNGAADAINVVRSNSTACWSTNERVGVGRLRSAMPSSPWSGKGGRMASSSG